MVPSRHKPFAGLILDEYYGKFHTFVDTDRLSFFNLRFKMQRVSSQGVINEAEKSERGKNALLLGLGSFRKCSSTLCAPASDLFLPLQNPKGPALLVCSTLPNLHLQSHLHMSSIEHSLCLVVSSKTDASCG
jgi:hypothetical protein